MSNPPLLAVKCPNTRRKGLNTNAICNNLLMVDGPYAYCYHCCQFYVVEHPPDALLRLKGIDKKQIVFKWLICELR